LTLGVLAPQQPSPVPVGGGMSGHTPEFVACPRCQSPNIPINRFCTRCGQPLVALSGVTCRQCGQLNARGQRFCTRCGSGLD
jgi:predicted amidophosphoribosyltransferase